MKNSTPLIAISTKSANFDIEFRESSTSVLFMAEMSEKFLSNTLFRGTNVELGKENKLRSSPLTFKRRFLDGRNMITRLKILIELRFQQRKLWKISEDCKDWYEKEISSDSVS